MRKYYVYILTSKRNGPLYVGVTNDIARRVHEHKSMINKFSFTSRYKISKLVYYEEYRNINEAIHREKCIKEWRRVWKIDLIEKNNPSWRDLYEDFSV